MKERIIIDGNNLIHKIPALKKIFSGSKENSQTVVCDSIFSRPEKSRSIEIVFDGYGKFKRRNVTFSESRTADEIVREIIEKNYDREKLCVVSDDKGITNLARACACTVISPLSFWNKLKAGDPVTSGKNINQNFIYGKEEKPETVSRKDLAVFKKLFS